MRRVPFLLLLLALLVLPYRVSWGQNEGEKRADRLAFGLRAGYGSGPDQFVIGAQAVSKRVLKVARFAPSVDFGFGSGFTTVMLNLDLRLLRFSPPKSTGGVYFAVSPALAILDAHDAGSDTEVGISLVGGVNLPMGGSNAYNLEARFGVGDLPDFRLLFGILLGGGKPAAKTNAGSR